MKVESRHGATWTGFVCRCARHWAIRRGGFLLIVAGIAGFLIVGCGKDQVGPDEADDIALPADQPEMDEAESIDGGESAAPLTLYEAVLDGNVEVVRSFLDDGHDPNAPVRGNTPALHIAARFNRWEVVELLLDYGADIHLRVAPESTALHWAARAGSLDAVQVLVEAGADINAREENGRTPLFYASGLNHEAVVAYLEEQGAVR